MKTDLQPHHDQIQKVGKLLWGFSWFWLIFNVLALLIAIGAVVVLGALGRTESHEAIVKMFTRSDLVPGLDAEVVRTIVSWDYESYLDHFWLTLFYISAALVFFVVTMVLILKIASAWKRSDVFGESPIRCFRILGWIYLIHGVIGQVWGMASQVVGNSNTGELLYFSFIRDTCLLSFATTGSGIEWGFLALALSWILKHAQLIREDQALVV